MMKNLDDMELGFIGCAVILVLLAGVLCLEGWIGSLLWNWIAPVFWTNAPSVTTWEALGAMIILDMIGCLLFRWRNNN